MHLEENNEIYCKIQEIIVRNFNPIYHFNLKKAGNVIQFG